MFSGAVTTGKAGRRPLLVRLPRATDPHNQGVRRETPLSNSDQRSKTRRYHAPNVRARAQTVKETALQWYIARGQSSSRDRKTPRLTLFGPAPFTRCAWTYMLPDTPLNLRKRLVQGCSSAQVLPVWSRLVENLLYRHWNWSQTRRSAPWTWGTARLVSLSGEPGCSRR